MNALNFIFLYLKMNRLYGFKETVKFRNLRNVELGCTNVTYYWVGDAINCYSVPKCFCLPF